jgi:HSP20 family molecular chaperone IbpA
MNSVFEDFFGRSSSDLWGDATKEFLPRVDVSETGKEMRITAELPGLDEQDVEVMVTSDMLTIKGEKKVEKEEEEGDYCYSERNYGRFERTIALPQGIDADNASGRPPLRRLVMKKDYYLILRLTPEATAEEIRSAYRRLAIELHPDLSGFGSDPFLELQEAYSVLSDPMRRAIYDREAQEIPIRRTNATRPTEIVIRRRHSAEPLTPVRSVRGFEEISLLGSFETFHPSFREMFDRLWSNFELVTRPKAERLENLTVDVPLSPDRRLRAGRCAFWCRPE